MIKQILYIILFIFTIFSCEQEKERVIIQTPCKHSKPVKPLGIIFEMGFDQDTVTIKGNNINLYHKIITSDNSTGQAATAYLDTAKLNHAENIFIIINNKTYKLPPSCRKIITLNYDHDTLYVKYMDKAKMYY